MLPNRSTYVENINISYFYKKKYIINIKILKYKKHNFS